MKLDVSQKIELPPHQLSMWGETLTAFSWHASAMVHCFYELLNPDKGRMVATFLGPDRVPEWFIAGTNGKRCFFVADRFFELDILEQVFLASHETCHPMLGHIVASAYYRQRGYIDVGFKHLPWDDTLANMAQDFVINDLLVQSRIGKFVKGGCHDPTIGTYKDSWIDVYERLYDQQKEKGSKGNPQILGPDGKPCPVGNPGTTPGVEPPPKGPPTRNGQKGFDAHMDFGQGEPDTTSENTTQNKGKQGEPVYTDLLTGDETVSETDMQREMKKAQQATAAAMELARSQGRLPGPLRIFCEKVLEPVVSWQDHIRSQLSRRLGSGGYDFRRPDRRLLVRDIIVPGRSGHGANIVIVGGDSSGSIWGVPKLTGQFMGEVGGMMEDVKPREVHVAWCDAKIRRIDVCLDMRDVHKMIYDGVPGGGGTDFRPVFDYIESLNADIDCLVYLTDGDGTFPKKAPPYPVIWGDISGNPKKYPFGDVVHIPVPNSAQPRRF